MAKTFKFTDFLLTDYGMTMNIDSLPDEVGDTFYVSYFGGAYKEKFKFVRALTSKDLKKVEHLYKSENGSRVIFFN